MSSLEKPDWSKVAKPHDDGAANHLQGSRLPSISLPATDGAEIDLGALEGLGVIYIYPMTGRPDTPLPDGWDLIPGARGCTPQSCSFRDHKQELKDLGVEFIFGLSTQPTAYQKEAVERLHLPFSLLSDENLAFQKALNLPRFTVDGMTLIKRMSFIVRDGLIVKVFYPVFPPDQDAENIIHFLKTGQAS